MIVKGLELQLACYVTWVTINATEPVRFRITRRSTGVVEALTEWAAVPAAPHRFTPRAYQFSRPLMVQLSVDATLTLEIEPPKPELVDVDWLVELPILPNELQVSDFVDRLVATRVPESVAGDPNDQLSDSEEPPGADEIAVLRELRAIASARTRAAPTRAPKRRPQPQKTEPEKPKPTRKVRLGPPKEEPKE